MIRIRKVEDMELTLKEYAASLNLSYEAVRASFKRHEGKDLVEGEHFTRSGRTTILTEAGITVMNGYRPKLKNLPPAVNPADVAEYQRQIVELQDQIKTLEDQKAALEAANADLQLQIVALKDRIQERSDALIEAFNKLQAVEERLLTTTLPPEPEQKAGFFSRLFNKRHNS